MLKVHAKKLDAIQVLCLEGRIVNGETEMLRNIVQLASDDTPEIILDLSEVSVVDAHGLGVLLQLREQTLANGIHFELLNLNNRVSTVFEITRLDTVFEIYSSAEFVPKPCYVPRLLFAA